MPQQPAPIVSAAYCIANDINPKAIISVAQFNERRGRAGADVARRLRALAREVDAATGYFARFRGRVSANDNRRQKRAASPSTR